MPRRIVVASAALLALAGAALLLLPGGGSLSLGPSRGPPPPGPATAPPAPGAAAAPAHPAAATTATVEGLVLDARGEPAGPGVEVVAERVRVDVFRAVATTEADGRFRVAVPLSFRQESVPLRATDPRTGHAGAGYATVIPGIRVPFVLLRLEPLLEIRGRVVDAAGRPAPGRAVRVKLRSVAGDEVVTSGEDGRFSVRLRRAESGVAVARDRDGVLGPSVAFEVPATEDVDLGDVGLAGDAVTEWSLRIVDLGRKPVPEARVRIEGDPWWYGTRHPAWSDADRCLHPDADGRLRLVFATRADPVRITAGGLKFLPQPVELPCPEPGRHEAIVILTPKVAFSVRLTGGAAADLLRRGGLDLVVRPDGGYTIPDVWNPLTGRSGTRHVSGGRVDVVEEEGGWRVYAPALGRFHYELRRGAFRGDLLAKGRWDVEAEWHERVVDLPVSDGRFVALDTRALHRWAREHDARCWSAPWAAWPVEDDSPAACEVDGWDPGDDRVPTPLLHDRRTPAVDRVEIWVPANCRAIRFGFPDDPPLDAHHGALEHAVVLPLPPEGEAIEAPAPEELLGMTVPVRFRVLRDGRPFRRAGIPIRMQDGGVLTDEAGEAVVHLFQGTFDYWIDTEIAPLTPEQRDRQVLEIRPPAGEIVVPLELVWRK